jgi:hypothetical protein
MVVFGEKKNVFKLAISLHEGRVLLRQLRKICSVERGRLDENGKYNRFIINQNVMLT